MLCPIKGIVHLLKNIVKLNENLIPTTRLLVSFDIKNISSSIDTQRGIVAVKYFQISEKTKKPSIEFILEDIKECTLLNLLQTNRAATGAPNPCSYTDAAIYSIDKKEQKQD